MWIKMAWLSYWPPRSQQVSHQIWMWGIYCMQVMEQANEGFYPGFKSRADITRSPKQGYQWPNKKDLPSKNKKEIPGEAFLSFFPSWICRTTVLFLVSLFCTWWSLLSPVRFIAWVRWWIPGFTSSATPANHFQHWKEFSSSKVEHESI